MAFGRRGDLGRSTRSTGTKVPAASGPSAAARGPCEGDLERPLGPGAPPGGRTGRKCRHPPNAFVQVEGHIPAWRLSTFRVAAVEKCSEPTAVGSVEKSGRRPHDLSPVTRAAALRPLAPPEVGTGPKPPAGCARRTPWRSEERFGILRRLAPARAEGPAGGHLETPRPVLEEPRHHAAVDEGVREAAVVALHRAGPVELLRLELDVTQAGCAERHADAVLGIDGDRRAVEGDLHETRRVVPVVKDDDVAPTPGPPQHVSQLCPLRAECRDGDREEVEGIPRREPEPEAARRATHRPPSPQPWRQENVDGAREDPDRRDELQGRRGRAVRCTVVRPDQVHRPEHGVEGDDAGEEPKPPAPGGLRPGEGCGRVRSYASRLRAPGLRSGGPERGVMRAPPRVRFPHAGEDQPERTEEEPE